MRTPSPVRFTARLWARIRPRTSRLTCQEALSQIRSNASLPSAASFWAHQRRKAAVTALTGRPSTNLSHIRPGAPAGGRR